MRFTRLLAPLTLSVVILQSQKVCAYRPFDLTDADVVENRGIELEIGPVTLQRSTDELVLVAPSLVVNYGIRPRFELVVEGKNKHSLRSWSDNRWRPQEFAVSIKALVRSGSLQDEGGLSIAMEPSLLVPGRDQAGVGAQVGVILSALWTTGALHLNVVPGMSRAHNPAGAIGIIAEGPFDWRIRPVGEWVASEEFGAGWLVSMLYGFIVRAGETCSFDGAIRGERIQGLTTLEIRAGLTWSFGS